MNLAFERKLYVIRKRAELAIRYSADEAEGESFYLPACRAGKSYIKGC